MSTSKVTLKSNADKVSSEFHQACYRALESCGQTGEGYAKGLCPVAVKYGGTLRQSINHKVDTANQVVYIGTNTEYAAYVELGTGIYYDGGRKTPWVYFDEKTQTFHMTHGQRAQPYLKPAVADHSATYNNIIINEMKNG